MRNIEYIKYCRTKAPEFQVRTQIVCDNQKRFVEKSALTDEGQSHIQSFLYNYEKLKGTYKNVEVVRPEYQGNTVVFPFVTGYGIAGKLEELLEEPHALIDLIKSYIKEIFVYEDKSMVEWEPSEEFERVFGNGFAELVGQPAVKVANIDAIFDNFLFDHGKFVCIDYEWTFEFPVPQQFILYRALFYFYSNNRIYLERYFSENEFLELCGLETKYIESYQRMEDSFQQYAHGENRKYIYTNQYVKYTACYWNNPEKLISQNKDFHQLRNENIQICSALKAKEEEREQLWKENVEYKALITKYRRVLRNPLYALCFIGRKISEKLKLKS